MNNKETITWIPSSNEAIPRRHKKLLSNLLSAHRWTISAGMMNDFNTSSARGPRPAAGL